MHIYIIYLHRDVGAGSDIHSLHLHVKCEAHNTLEREKLLLYRFPAILMGKEDEENSNYSENRKENDLIYSIPIFQQKRTRLHHTHIYIYIYTQK